MDIRWRWSIIVLSAMSIALAIGGMLQLRVQANYKAFFNSEDPQIKAFEALQETYTRDDNILFVLDHPDSPVFSKGYLETLVWLTKEAWKLPFVSRVDSITNFQHSEADGDELHVGDLVENPGLLRDVDIKRIENIARSEPMIVNRLISDQEHVAGINVTLSLPYTDANEPTVAAEAAEAARSLVQRFKQENPEYSVYLTGIVMLNDAFATCTDNDIRSILPLMYLGILVIMAFLLRSFMGTLTTLIVITGSATIGMGFMGFIGFPLSALMVAAPTVILTLAVADSIHMLVPILHQMGRGKEKSHAIIESMRINFQPIFLTSMTTTIGFLSLNWSDSPPFRQFGNVVAVGVLAAWALSITLIPALLSILPVQVKTRSKDGISRIEQFSEAVIRNRRTSLWGSVAAVIILAAFIPRINLDDRWAEYFSDKIEFRTATDYTIKNLTGIYTAEYSIESNESGGINNPEYLKHLDQFTVWLRTQAQVLQVSAYSDILKRLNKNMHGDDEAFYRVPIQRDMAAQFLLLFELSLPPGLDLNNQINIDRSATRLIILLDDLSTKELRAFTEKVTAWQSSNLPSYMQTPPAGQSTLFAHISERNIRSMLAGTAIAGVLISLLIGLALKSVRYCFLSLIPNFVPAIMGFGAWGLLVSEMGMSLSVVTGMTLGIIVDDTVHFLTQYLRARREFNASPEEAVRYAFRNVGQALVITTVILVVGFAILSSSPFRLNEWLGQLTAIVIIFALVTDFILLPALLITFDRKQP